MAARSVFRERLFPGARAVQTGAMKRLLPGLIVLCALSAPCLAGKVDVVGVTYDVAADGSFTFHVTVRHDDDGWAHFADKWQVLAPDGTVLGETVLGHPHDTEQPFTRSQSGIRIPETLGEVRVRAHDKLHGWDGAARDVAVKNRLPGHH